MSSTGETGLVSLDEEGYQLTASLRDNEAMKCFLRRVLCDLDGKIVVNEGMLSGFAPWYSGISATQSFARLVEELRLPKCSEMVRPMTGIEIGQNASLNETGYKKVASLLDNSAMEAFIRRVISSSDGQILSEPMLSGVIPWYSGVSATQSFARLTQELHEEKLSSMVQWVPTCSADLSTKWQPPRCVVAWAGPYHIHVSWEDSTTAESFTSAVLNGVNLYHVYWSASSDGPFEKMTTAKPLQVCTFCEYVGSDPQTRFYYLTTAASDGKSESDGSEIVSAKTTGDAGIDDDDAFLDFIQRGHFEYFCGFAEPTGGATRESYRPFKSSGESEALRHMHEPGLVTIGGTGLGIANLVVGAARGFIRKVEACRRLLRLLDFLEKADRFHGVWPHWLWGTTGRVQPFGAKDDGADLVESCFLFQSLLIARAFFDSKEDTFETQIRERATRLWEAAEFDHFVKDGKLMWHWSPNHAFNLGLAIGGFNEAQICYLLGVCHPKHAIAPEVYVSGWANGNPARYTASLQQGKTPLFWTHLSYYGFDPRHGDRFCESYFDIMCSRTQAHIDYAESNPKGAPDYGAFKLWGLSACFTRAGYQICSPSNDVGVVAPFAACSAFPYKPKESLAAMKHMYKQHARDLWGAGGFKDSISPGEAFVCQLYVGLDQSTVAPMIENGRTGLLWSLFMSNDEAKQMVRILEQR